MFTLSASTTAPTMQGSDTAKWLGKTGKIPHVPLYKEESMPTPRARADDTAQDVVHLPRPEVTATQPAWIHLLLITDSQERKNFS